MSDGANLGIKASSALKVILGGEPQEEQESMTPEEFTAWIRSCPDKEVEEWEDAYSEASRLIARYMLQVMEAHPSLDWTLSGNGVDAYDEAKNASPPQAAWAFDDCTGFMVGWAFNAARTILKLQPVQNPALVEVEF